MNMINWLSSHFALVSAGSLSWFHSASAADLYNVGKPQGHVEILDTLPSPQEFFTKYVKNEGGPFAGVGKPALFRGAAKAMPAYKKWTDEYLKGVHGNVKLDSVDTEKKEAMRKSRHAPGEWTLAKFLSKYKTADLYSNAETPKGLDKEVMLLPVMHCGGFTRRLEGSVMWFSSGGTRSVLHQDSSQNIHCMIDGQKDWIVWDPRSGIDDPGMGWVDAEKEAKKDPNNPKWKVTYGTYSGNIDPDNVDVAKYPKWKNIKWWKISMQAGDCAFVPAMWFHYVTAPAQRAISVHIWFEAGKTFDTKSCNDLAARGYNISEPAYSLADCNFGGSRCISDDGWKRGCNTECKLPAYATKGAKKSRPEL